MTNRLSSQFLAGLLYVLAGTAAFSAAAVYNGFPLLYPDSIAYLLGHQVPMRAPGYGWVTAPLRLLDSIWLYVVFQSAIVAHLIYLLVRTRVTSIPVWRFLLLLALLTVGTTLPWITGFVMADIFSGILVPSIYLLLFRSRHMTFAEQCYLYVLTAAACTAHLLNAVVAASLWGLIAVSNLAGLTQISRQRLFSVFAAIIFAVALLVVNTRMNYGVWTPAAGGYVFPLARLVANGQVKEYLDSHCAEQQRFEICAYRNDLPESASDFVWHEKSPVNRLGGLLGYRAEGTSLLLNTVLDQPRRTFITALEQAERALKSFHLRYIYFDQSNSWVESEIKKRFPANAHQFTSARQNTKDLDLIAVDELHRRILLACVGLSVLLIALAGFNRFQSRPVSVGLIVLFSVALVLNGLALGVFGQEVSERYMTRMIWLLPAAVFITVLFRDVRNVKTNGGNRH